MTLGILETYMAHVRRDAEKEWATQSLDAHLSGTSRMAGDFAADFGNRDWGELLGFWHDLGKFVPDWQKHIRKGSGYDVDAHIETTGGRVNHSSAGAVLAFERLKGHPVARAIAYPIAGHHAGLPDWYPDDAAGIPLPNRVYTDPLACALDTKDLDRFRFLEAVQVFLQKPFPQSAPMGLSGKEKLPEEHLHLWIRMLFSCLVDADFLDTENFMDGERASCRGGHASLSELKARFDAHMERKQRLCDDTAMNQNRREILAQCRRKAAGSPGFYTLTVPTGGGKTLSSMAFALEHALLHGKRRVIMAIPYTSIIEQTAKIFKYGTDDNTCIKETLACGEELFGEENVVEHHSNLDPDKEDARSRLASENWDAPIIVTTNVQLFESLFACRSSKTRKLHNMVNSVIILDEAQMLPPEFLKPILSVLRGLVNHFGVTVVLCTATQPALTGSIGSGEALFHGLEDAVEIMDAPRELAEKFRRVTVTFPSDEAPRCAWEDVATELKRYDQVLCIVNTRSDCRALHALMPEETIHLSALMCGEERSDIIADVKRRLRSGSAVRVVSTQLVEAGVDIDFPVVYRALAGLDSVAQAAGRCNREGRAASGGRVVVFKPPKSAPPGFLRKGEDACGEMLRARQMEDLDPEFFLEYFRLFFAKADGFDKPRFEERLVKEARDFRMQFRSLAMHFNLIDDAAQKSIVVRYDGLRNSSEPLLEMLRHQGPSRWLSRKLQRFTVSVQKNLFDKICKTGMVEEVHGFYVQAGAGLYRPGLGLLTDDKAWSEESLIA